jgi:WD40 repeat protein
MGCCHRHATPRQEPEGGFFSSVGFSPDGKRLASACGAQDEGVKVWDVATGNEVLNHEVPGCTNSVAFSAEGKHLAAGGSVLGKKDEGPVGGFVKIWEATSVPLNFD